MTAKEFLQQAGNTHLAVESRLEQIARLQSLATKATTVMNGVPTAGTSAGSVIETCIGEVQEQSALLAEEISRMVDARNEVAEAIARVENVDERTLLELRYLCRFSFREITKRMFLSIRKAFQLHNQALRSVSQNLQSRAY